jgi:hypothetical protein
MTESQSSFFQQKDNRHPISQACQGFPQVFPDLMVRETSSAYPAISLTSTTQPTVAHSPGIGFFFYHPTALLTWSHTSHRTPVAATFQSF